METLQRYQFSRNGSTVRKTFLNMNLTYIRHMPVFAHDDLESHDIIEKIGAREKAVDSERVFYHLRCFLVFQTK